MASLNARLVISWIYDTRDVHTWLSLAKSIADENHITMEMFHTQIWDVLNGTRPKINTLVFIGASDSGKSVICDALSSFWETPDIGHFRPPLTTTGSSFWLQDLLGKQLYRCDELYLERPEIMQTIKQLFEGHANLKTEIKYEGHQNIPRRPVLVSLNGNSSRDICKFQSSEFQAIKNRCYIYVMNNHMKSRINRMSYIDDMIDNAKHFLQNIFHYYGENKKEQYEDRDEITIRDIVHLLK